MSYPIAVEPEQKYPEDVEENEVCPECGGTGKVENLSYDKDSHEWITDGTRKCVCQLEN